MMQGKIGIYERRRLTEISQYIKRTSITSSIGTIGDLMSAIEAASWLEEIPEEAKTALGRCFGDLDIIYAIACSEGRQHLSAEELQEAALLVLIAQDIIERLLELPSAKCPVCGYGLVFLPWNDDSPSYETCDCCGILFGYDDVPGGESPSPREEIYKQLRQQWISQGCPWRGDPELKPPNWDPKRQLEEADLLRDER
jgi:hypothetical protein